MPESYEKLVEKSVKSILDLHQFILDKIVERKVYRNKKFKGKHNNSEIQLASQILDVLVNKVINPRQKIEEVTNNE